MDEELKELAALALRNAFWRDFSGLVNKYLQASEGLDIAAQEMQMGAMTSIYGRDVNETTDVILNIWTQDGALDGDWWFDTTGHATILAALNHAPAKEVHLKGKMVFVKKDGEWRIVDE